MIVCKFDVTDRSCTRAVPVVLHAERRIQVALALLAHVLTRPRARLSASARRPREVLAPAGLLSSLRRVELHRLDLRRMMIIMQKERMSSKDGSALSACQVRLRARLGLSLLGQTIGCADVL